MVGYGAVPVSLGAFATGTSLGSFSSSGVTADSAPTEVIEAGWEHLSRYNPLLGHDSTVEGSLSAEPSGVLYWQRDIQSNGAAVTITVSLNGAAVGGETVSYVADGDALEGIHWTTTSPKTVTLVKGQRSFTVVVTPVESGKWYRERTTKLRLSASGLNIDGQRGFVHLVFNSAVLPPVVTLSAVVTEQSRGTTPIVLTVTTASYAVQDPVYVRWEVVSGPAFTSTAHKGVVVIAAGATSGTFEIVQADSNTGSLLVQLVYERGETLFTQSDYDTSLNTFTVDRNVHLDENLWRRSNDLNLLRMDAWASDPIRPLTPGHPCSHTGGGATSPRQGEGEALSIPQDAVVPLQDPITGNALRLFHPHPLITKGMSYFRESFEVSYGGGAATAHLFHDYVMVKLYFTEMLLADAARNAEFVHLRVRVRNCDRNHGVTFRFSHVIDDSYVPGAGADGAGTLPGWMEHSDGTDVGSNNFIFPSGLKVWEYSKVNGHADSNGGWGSYYGAGSDEYGTYLYFKHKCDGGQSYALVADGSEPAHGGTGALGDSGWWRINPGKNLPDPSSPDVAIYREYNVAQGVASSPGQVVASGVPIEYPIWTDNTDRSQYAEDMTGARTNRLLDVRNGRRGTLIHSLQFKVNAADILPPDPAARRFWPGEKSRWDPQGGAIITDGTTDHQVTINITR